MTPAEVATRFPDERDPVARRHHEQRSLCLVSVRHGNVRMNEGEAAFTASVEIRNDLASSARPWHVHYGTCASGGGIVATTQPITPVHRTRRRSRTGVTIRGIGLDPSAAYT